MIFWAVVQKQSVQGAMFTLKLIVVFVHRTLKHLAKYIYIYIYKKLFLNWYQPEGKRNSGRPLKRWKDSVL
jgi:hypothetical protein